MKLSTEQEKAFSLVQEWRKDKSRRRFVVGGFAGTGKTTFAKFVANDVDPKKVKCGAYTGKAANVLREKDMPNASTLHDIVYKRVDDDTSDEPRFVLNRDNEHDKCKLLIVDEYSMLPEEMINDIEHLYDKVLYLGDTFQLPPVHGECSLKPDFFLTEIHRQALENPIIRFSKDIREGKALTYMNLPEFHYDHKSKIDRDTYEQADQVLVGLNKTRVGFNNRFREKLGLAGIQYPVVNDKLICLRNNHAVGIFNGMIAYATADAHIVRPQTLRLDIDGFEDLKVWDGNFRGEDRQHEMFKDLDRFDYGYAITVHKSQGSEWDHVLVYNQPIGRDAVERRRWLYTALTRAKKKVTLVNQ